MDLGLQGKTAVITGGGKGIGYAAAKAFLKEGTNVVICARNLGDAVETLSEFGNIKGITADMTRQEDANRLADFAYEAFGRIDCWVNNVGASFPKEGVEYNEQQIDRVAQVCFHSVIYGSQAAFRYMKQTGGAIVNISSLASRCGTTGASTLYGPLKAAVERLSVAFAGEYAAYGVRVNTVRPGFTMTPAVKATIEKKYLERKENDTLLRRLAEPDEIAAPVVFLCGTGASYMTGTAVDVTGGMGMTLNPEYSYEKKDRSET